MYICFLTWRSAIPDQTIIKVGPAKGVAARHRGKSCTCFV